MTDPTVARSIPAAIVNSRAYLTLASLARRVRPHAPWIVYIALALVCTEYLNSRADLIPKWGEWYGSDGHPYILMQVRSFLSGHLALVRHPGGAGHDYFWGRGGLHTGWGLGVPILATPFHLLGRLFGAPGFPDSVRFLILYALTTVALARALHMVSPKEPNSLIASAAAAGFVMVFPTYVGMVSSRFQIYEQTIAVGALWSVALLAGILALLHKATPGRLLLVCAAAGFADMIRIPLAFYGPATAVLAIIIAHRKGVMRRWLVAGLLTYALVAALYFVGNVLRFGGPLNAGYDNCLCSAFPNRLTRWDLPFSKVSFAIAAKEMYATLFLLEPVNSQVFGPPPSVQAYAVSERWREYYAPTYDRLIFWIWVAAFFFVCWSIVRKKLWRPDRPLDNEVATVIGAWALPPSFVLFAFYMRIPNLVTRYATDFYPAFAAMALCMGMVMVAAVRKRSPGMAGSMQLGLAGAVVLYNSGWQGWATHLSVPVDRKTILERIADIDSHGAQAPRSVPRHLKCHEPRGPQPMTTHLDEWWPDCSFSSGMVFAMPHSPCVSFTLAPHGPTWGPAEQESLDGFRLNGDFDHMKACGPPLVEGETRRLTMCEPRQPRFLLDGLRLYTVGSLDAELRPLDRLKLLQIDAASSCQ